MTWAKYAEKVYPAGEVDEKAEGAGSEEDEQDIEAEIKREVETLNQPKKKALFRAIKLDIQCGMVSYYGNFQDIDRLANGSVVLPDSRAN